MTSTISAELKSILELTRRFAMNSKSDFRTVATEHYFLALLESPSQSSWLTGSVLRGNAELIARAKNETLHFACCDGETKSDGGDAADITYSPSFARALDVAHHIVQRFGNQEVQTIDPLILFVAILSLTLSGERPTGLSTILTRLCIALDAAMNAVVENSGTPFLSEFLVETGNNNNNNFFTLNHHQNLQQPAFAEIVRAQVSKIDRSPSPNSCLDENPTARSHWVYPGKLCCGRTPSCSEDDFRDLVTKARVNTFISLQKTYREYSLPDYRTFLNLKDEAGNNKIIPTNPLSDKNNNNTNAVVEFYHAPCEDFQVTSDSLMMARLEEIRRLFEECKNGNRVIYVHCFMGHGRTGGIVSNLMSMIENIPVCAALKKLQNLHATRSDCAKENLHCNLGRGVFELEIQYDQAARMEGRVHKIFEKYFLFSPK